MGLWAANEVKRASRLVFIFPPPFPFFPIPHQPYPVLHSPRPPRICRGLCQWALYYGIPSQRQDPGGLVQSSAPPVTPLHTNQTLSTQWFRISDSPNWHNMRVVGSHPWAWWRLHRLVKPRTQVCCFCLSLLFVCFWLFSELEMKKEVMVMWCPPRLEPLVKQNMCRFGNMELISQPFQLQGLQYVNFRGWNHICGFMEIKIWFPQMFVQTPKKICWW